MTVFMTTGRRTGRRARSGPSRPPDWTTHDAGALVRVDCVFDLCVLRGVR